MKVRKEDFLKYINDTITTQEFDDAKVIELSIFEYEKDDGKRKNYFTIDFAMDEGLISNDESLEEI